MWSSDVLSFSIAEFERFAYQRDYKNLESCILELIDYLAQKKPIEDYYVESEAGEPMLVSSGLSPMSNLMGINQKQEFYSRLAAALTSYLSDCDFQHNEDVLNLIVCFKSVVGNIFYLSSYHNLDHILWNRGLMNDDGSLLLQDDNDIKWLIVCYSMNSNLDIDYRELINLMPKLAIYGYLGLLYNYSYSLNQRHEYNHKKLIAMHDVLKSIELDDFMVSLLSSPWMMCSYWDVNNRHDIKLSINYAIEKWLDKKLSKKNKFEIDKNLSRAEEVKTIVVISEQYASGHAMYRCYHNAIKALSDKYRLVLVSVDDCYDEISMRDFHDVVNVSHDPKDTNDTVNKILNLSPDIVVYPSLGMATWTIPLCNIRLANKQIMLYGHPASAFSKYIDLGVSSGFRKGVNYQKFLMESFYLTDDFNLDLTLHPEYNELPRSINKDGVVRIAINSTIQKITSRFVSLCAILNSHSKVPIEFSFFMATTMDSQLHAFEKSLRSEIGDNIVVYPPTSYMIYMDRLSKCDFAIGTFPFGGTNTNLDLLLLGIPKIFYTDSDELACHADKSFFSMFDMPGVLTPTSEVEIVTSCLRLIHDQEERNRISLELKNIDLNDRVISSGKQSGKVLLEAVSKCF